MPALEIEAIQTQAIAPYAVSASDRLDIETALELWGRATTAGVFNHPTWWQAALDAFGEGRPLRVVAVHQASVLVALWPLWVKRLGAREGFARIIEPIGARVTDYCMPLLAKDHDPGHLIDLLMHTTVQMLDAQTLLLWPKVPIAESYRDSIDQALHRPGALLREYERPCAAMSVPKNYEDLQQRWSKSHRGDVRRQIKRLRAVGRLELVQLSNRAKIQAMLPRLYSMHSDNWRSRTGFSELEAGPMTTFIAKLADLMPETLIDASEVRVDGVTIASHFGFRHDNTIHWYKPAFNLAWSKFAPGKVHIALTAQAAVADGVDKIDFMQGTEPYKHRWSDLTTLTKSFAIARPIAYPLWAWNTSVRRFAAEYRI